jgi:sialidase-1
MGEVLMKKRLLRIESLEERHLLAVWAGAEIVGGTELTAPPFPTAAPSGQRVGDVYVESTIDIDKDGFIGPAEFSYMGYNWFKTDRSEDWDPSCDIDGDGFVGPGDYALLSSYWFKSCVDLPVETLSYQIYPSDMANWEIYDDGGTPVTASDGLLTLDARGGAVEAVCAYDDFGENIRVTADFKSTVSSTGIRAGLELAVQPSGERYYAEFRQNTLYLYYVEAGNNMTQLSSASCSIGHMRTYTVWAQVVDGQVACGIGDETFLAVNDSRLFGGKVGFYSANGVETFSNISVRRDPETVTVTPTNQYVIVAKEFGALNYMAFPDVCRLNDGRLMAVVYVGYSHVSYPSASCPRGGRICATYSYDDGRTWTSLQSIADTAMDDRDPSVVQLEDGRILCTFFTLDPDESNVNRLITTMTESGDGGVTWTTPETVYAGYAVSSPIRILSNGTLLMPLYRQAEGTAWGAVGISYDQGGTWSSPVTIPRNGFRLDAETDIIERLDGTLYAIQRYEMCYSVSDDNGETWSPSLSVGFHGSCPYLFRASNNVVVMALREESQTTIRISLDDCNTWSGSIVVDNVAGAYPSIVQRNDGTYLILYYEEGNGSNIRARCFSLDDDGNVTWNLL